MKRYRSVKLTYKGQHIESETSVEGPLPEWAPEELKEIEALLPVAPEPSTLSEADFESAFADLDLDDGDIDVSAFAGMTFDPNAEIPATEVITDFGAVSAEDPAQLSLTDLGVSTRWVNKFAEAGVTTVADLQGMNEDDVLNLPGIGQKAVEELQAGLEAHGIDVLV